MPDEEGRHRRVRLAGDADAPAAADLLYRFNREYDEPTPPPPVLARRISRLLASGETAVLLVGAGPDGVAVLRFRPSLWTEGLECYLAELYVVPTSRGRGQGRALLAAAIEEARRRGADSMDLGTSEADVAAIGLYQSFGFTNREHDANGPVMFVYERDLR